MSFSNGTGSYTDRTPIPHIDGYPAKRERRKRDTLGNKPVLKAFALAISACGLIITVLVIVWGAAVLVSSKADKAKVHEIDKQVVKVRAIVDNIKEDQDRLLRAFSLEPTPVKE